MKRKLYTKSHDLGLLKDIDNDGGIFTAAEHSYISKKENEKYTKSKESLLHHYLSLNAKMKFSALGFVIDYINASGFQNVLSMGAGECVLEYLLRLGLPGPATVTATDFDSFFIEKANEFFPSIFSIRFDFFQDDVKDLQKKTGIDFDISIFFGSSYVMDDLEFIKLFNDLREIRVKRIKDFHAGYIDWQTYILNQLTPLKNFDLIRKLFGKAPLGKDGYRGKFHGYGRSRGELRKLYKLAGLRLRQELKIGTYKYVAICSS
jgi:hypothetical protein